MLVTKGLTIVTRFDHVQEVLSRDWVFQVPYRQKMERVTAGQNFFLGMQNTPEYTRDVSNMRLAVRRTDVDERIAPFVTRTAEDILAASGGRDVVQTLTRVVPTRLLGDYFGTPGWDENEFTDAATAMFQYSLSIPMARRLSGSRWKRLPRPVPISTPSSPSASAIGGTAMM